MTQAAPDPARRLPLLLDTHVLVWLMFGETKLGKQARRAIDVAARTNRLFLSAITPWEIAVLVSKRRIDLHQDTMEWVRAAISLPGVTLVPLEPEIAVASTRLPWEMHPDPADRMLVATARHLSATLVTADRMLLAMARKGNFRALDATV
ncbi:MAG: type II toxin-antitoxin system VapC family toxin [Terracidiphilus sp.]